MTEDTCDFGDCSRSGPLSRGMCAMHYRRWARHGDPSTVRVTRKTDEQVLRDALGHVSENGCWIAAPSRVSRSTGYATVWRSGRAIGLHRLAYLVHVAPIPEGFQVDHLCRTPDCFNPEHLEAVTAKENTRRSPFTRASINAAVTECPQGHPYDETNTYRHAATGSRHCRTCISDRARARYYRNKAVA